jgi:hypothetical protein
MYEFIVEMRHVKSAGGHAIELRHRAFIIAILDEVFKVEPTDRNRYDHAVLSKWMEWTRAQSINSFPIFGLLVAFFIQSEFLVAKDAREDVVDTLEKFRFATSGIFIRDVKTSAGEMKGEADSKLWEAMVDNSKWRLRDWQCIKDFLAPAIPTAIE